MYDEHHLYRLVLLTICLLRTSWNRGYPPYKEILEIAPTVNDLVHLPDDLLLQKMKSLGLYNSRLKQLKKAMMYVLTHGWPSDAKAVEGWPAGSTVKRNYCMFLGTFKSEVIPYLTSNHSSDLSRPEKELLSSMRFDRKTIMLDIGAADGNYSAYLADKFEFVNAYEPNQVASQVMKYRFKDMRNVGIHSWAVSSNHSEEMYLLHYTYLHNGIKIKYEDYSGYSYPIFCGKIDETFPESTKIGFIKIDTEGAEYDILLGAQETLKKKPALLIEIHPPFKESEEKIRSLLSGYDKIERVHKVDEQYYLLCNVDRG